MDQDATIRWDIVEEHLDEAGFLYGQWEAALRSPDYTLAEIADGPEERMLAHLDGLVLGGPRVAKKLLLPALAGDEPGLVFAATFALVDGGRPEDLEAVFAALEKGEPVQRAAIRRALEIVPRPDLGQRLAALALKAPPALQADLLEVLGYLRVDPGLRLEPLLSQDEALAIRLARAFPDKLDPVAIDRSIASPDPQVRATALETGVVLGHRSALGACEAEVERCGPAFGRAALLFVLSGDEKPLAPLAAALSEEKLRREAAFALGFTGRVSAAEALLAAMRDEKLAPVAAEGFSAITGLAVTKRFAEPPKRWNPGEEDEEEEPYGPEADLPKPVPETIDAWWEARPKLDPARRWLRGQPWTPEALLCELENGPARRREVLALDLAVRSRGEHQVAWDSLAARQRSELAKARGSARTSAGPVRNVAR